MIDLKIGDCLEKMKDIEDNSVDFILCDPPYHLTSIVKRFGKKGSKEATTKNNDGSFSRLSKGFMGKEWDGVDENGVGVAFNIELWEEAMRVLKPGGYLMAFSGARTYHRMAVAIEDAGLEVKDMIEWIYGSGFPKALDISKAIDKKLGAERTETYIREDFFKRSNKKPQRESQCINGEKGIYSKPSSDLAKQYEGYKTQLKPSHEPLCLAMKPLSEKNFVDNVMKWGTGGLNIGGTRVGNEKRTYSGVSGSNNTFIDGCFGKGESNKTQYEVEGRYPANLIIHENIAPVLDKQNKDASRFFKNIEEEDTYTPFIYHAKASKKDRNIDVNGEQITGELKSKTFNGKSDKPSTDMKDVEKRFTTQPTVNNHATVKPTGLMKYLLKMGLPPIKDAVVLDMFAGSGSTGVALEQLNKEEGTEHKCILIEMEEEHAEIIKKRCCLSE